ncbi:PAS domain S-box protein [Halobacteriaceae archaeon GCM10025711]
MAYVERRGGRSQAGDAATRSTDIQYGTLLSATGDGVFRLDADARFVDLNDAMTDITGRDADQLRDEPITTILARTAALDELLAAPERADPVDVVVRTADGEPVYCELTVAPAAEGDGVLGLLRPTTEADHAPRDAVERAIEHMPGMLYRCRVDVDWSMQYVSDGVRSLVGYDPDDLESGDVSWGRDVIHPDDRDTVRETVLAAVEDDETYELSYRVLTADGDVRWVWERGSPDDEETLTGFIADVTTQHETEHDLLRERERFQSMVDAVEDYAIFMLDPEGHVTSWNRGAERIKGYAREEILGEHYSTFYTEPDVENDIPDRLLEEAARSERVEVEGWRVRKDGSTFWASVVITALRADDGSLRGFTKVVRDMTDRRKRTQQLKRQHALTEQILETSPVGIAVLSPDGTIEQANDRAAALLGLTDDGGPTEAGQRAIYDEDGEQVPPEDRPFSRVLETGEPVTDERFAIDLPDGDRRWLSVSAVPIRGDDGDIERIVTAGEDITDLVHQSERLERQRDELATELEEVYGRIDEAVFAIDDEFTITYVNENTADIVGRGVSDLVGSDFWEAFPDAADSTFEEHYRRALETQEAQSFEAYYEPLDIWVEVGAYPSESGLSVYFRDVTERIARERELERYEAIVETVDEGIYVVDDEGRFTLVNEAYAEMVGRSREELLGAHVSVVVDDDVVETARAMESDLESGDVDATTVEADIERPDGETVIAEATFTILTSEDGSFQRIGVVRDVTERKARERELEQYETIVETIWDGVYALDADDRFILANDQFLQMAGYTREELLGQPATVVYDDTIGEQAERLAEEVVAGERSQATLEFELRTADGDTFPVESRFGPYSTGDGVGRTGVVRDITERKAREEQVRRQRDQLSALTQLNRVVQDVNRALVQSSSREEVDQLVCDRLTESDSYRLAWICDADPHSGAVNPRAVAGEEADYLDGLDISLDDGSGDGPTGRAFRTREMAVAHTSDPDYERWADRAHDHGFRSTAAIPIVYDDVLYGVLNVYSTRDDAFDGQERVVVSHLGEIVGHALTALERKETLMSDRILEVEFRSVDAAGKFFDALGTDLESLAIERTVHAGDDHYLHYVRGTGLTPEAFREGLLRIPNIEDVRLVEDGDDGLLFTVTSTNPVVSSAVASYGGRIKHVSLEDDALRITAQFHAGVDTRAVLDALTDAVPDIELVAQRSKAADDARPADLDAALERLTQRQRAAVEAAYFGGYFDWPRGSNAEELAEEMGVTSPTLHQHLRKAQQTLLGVFFDDPEAGAAD